MKNSILVIDTDTIALKRLRCILSREGFNLMTATNIYAAERILREIDITYILAKTDFYPDLVNYNTSGQIDKKNPNK